MSIHLDCSTCSDEELKLLNDYAGRAMQAMMHDVDKRMLDDAAHMKLATIAFEQAKAMILVWRNT